MTTKITHTAVVPYSCEQMYALVNNIADYQSFVPYCKQSIVNKETDLVIEATLILDVSIHVPFLGNKHLKQAFKTRNTLFPHQRMDLDLLEGPMDYLKGEWRFDPSTHGQSRVTLNLTVAFSSKLWAMAFSAVSGRVGSTLVNAFVQRAHAIYGGQEGY